MERAAGGADEAGDRVSYQRRTEEVTDLLEDAGRHRYSLPSGRAPSGRLILPRPGRYGQRRLGTSTATACTGGVRTGASRHSESALAEVYAPGAPSDSSRFTGIQKIPPLNGTGF
ncbi:hypothetical protein TNCT6_41840 [Streptomyces sp. 6-11-2]|nr:hypothetical protein TNCT6_41840 [Streptomyces sp. 6-11-2]